MKLTLLAGAAVLASSCGLAPRPGSPALPLVGPVWRWEETLAGDDSRFAPDDPGRYTLQFAEEGSVSVRVDCNQAGGSYRLDGSSLAIRLGPSTRMACPEPSLGDVFAAQLGAAAIHFIRNGELFLDLQFDSGTMRFSSRPHRIGRVAGGEIATDPRNATYAVEDREVSLRRGQSEAEILPGSASRIATRAFGEPAYGDLDGDGEPDAALFLLQDSGGSGTFLYAAAALRREGAYAGTRAVLLGDRVAPRGIEIRGGAVIVTYADRRPGDPLAALPGIDVVRCLGLADFLAAAPPAPGPRAAPRGLPAPASCP